MLIKLTKILVIHKQIAPKYPTIHATSETNIFDIEHMNLLYNNKQKRK